MSAPIDARCDAPTCQCHELPSVRLIPSTNQKYTVEELPGDGVARVFAYKYLTEAA